MSHCTILAVILIVVGLLGSLKALKDRKDSAKSPCAKDLKMRDDQYLFVSASALLSGVALLVLTKKHDSASGGSLWM